MKRQFRIALDFSQLDLLATTNGQYRYAVDLIRGLARLKSDCQFLLLGSRSEPPPELLPLFSESDRWRYRRLPRSEFPGADYANQVRYSLILLRERISLLHSLHTFVPWFAPCPVVVTVYDLMVDLFSDYHEARRSRPYRIYKWAVKHRVRRVICISETTAADLRREWRLAGESIDVVPLGTNFGEAENSQGIQTELRQCADSSLVLLSPYNLEPRKNLTALLQATALLSARNDDLKLVLFGRAAVTVEREAAFAREVRELGIASHVVLTGVITDGELAELYRRSSLFVFPSLYEGFGLPVLEAMSVGACVVARNASAMAEVVGESGVLVETRDAKTLASTIDGLLDNPYLRRELGNAARVRARQFSLERMAKLTHQSYLAARKQMRRQKTEDKRQETEDRIQKTELRVKNSP
jgi:glycosyltransferase involved in cell wall biosynthesis